MDDYISRSDATQAKPEFLNESHAVPENALYAKGWNACNLAYIENLRAIPAADVRPVVLCRDCKWYNPSNRDWKCERSMGLVEPDEEDFCSLGERREAEE